MSKAYLWHFEEVGRVALVRLAYVKVTGDLVAGILLSQIVFWFKPHPDGSSKLRVFREGRYWLAKRREDWYQEIGISPKQFDRACDLLESMGIIHRKVFRFGRGTANHLNLDVKVLSKQLKSLLGTSPKVNSGMTQKATPIGLAQTSTPINTEKTPTEKTGDEKGKTPVDSKDTLKALQEKYKPLKGHPHSQPVKNTSELVKWWCRLVPYYHDVKFVPTPTGKQKGQLKQFMDKVGKDKAYGVMHWTIRKWEVFVVDVLENKGQTPIGKRPHIGIMLEHWDIAVRGFDEEKPVQSIAQDKGIKKLTDAELDAKLG